MRCIASSDRYLTRESSLLRFRCVIRPTAGISCGWKADQSQLFVGIHGIPVVGLLGGGDALPQHVHARRRQRLVGFEVDDVVHCLEEHLPTGHEASETVQVMRHQGPKEQNKVHRTPL